MRSDEPLAGRTLGVLCVLALVGCGSPTPPESLLLISLDTVRRDHLSLYDYTRPTTPNLDALARSSAVFDNGFSQGSTTNPTHASIFTGLYPPAHGLRRNRGGKMADDLPTLAGILSDAGFRTAGFVSGYPLRMADTGLRRGFETWNAEFEGGRRDGRVTTDSALEWLRDLEPTERFFLFVHLYDAHGPYEPNPEYLGTFRSTEPGPRINRLFKYQRIQDEQGQPIRHLNAFVDRYDTQIYYQDTLIGDLLAAIDLERTAVVVVADHGEGFNERRGFLKMNHGATLYDELVRIPFLIRSPGVVARRLDEPVEQVDLAPTSLDLLGLAFPGAASFQGETLAPLLRGERDERIDGLVFATTRSAPQRYRHRGYRLVREFLHSARSRRWKLIQYPGGETDYWELYDLEQDPMERTNVAEQYPDVVASMRAAIEKRLLAAVVEAPTPETSSEDLEQLRALGYVD